jgi:hypothetical protein
MRHGIVEGEPGMFPDPIARFLRWLFGPITRRRRKEAEEPQEPQEPKPGDE